MTDETTARDRAIELIHETLEWERERGAPIEEHADVVVDALLAHPEVLRALAGAPTADVTESLTGWERDYVRALNAILAAYDDNGADAHRWRGHAEAYRQVCERLRRDLKLPAVAYASGEWRQAHGVYSDEQVAEFRRIARDGSPAATPEGVDAAELEGS